MQLLILGGTLFLGRVIAGHALEAGHDVTLFNRGQTNPGLFPDAEQLLGDRDGDLSALTGRRFDAVVDTSGYFPRQVEAVAAVIGASVGHYTFVSSVSAYADHSQPGADEQAELATVEDPAAEELGENYGGFKALCEAALEAALPGRVHCVRPGLIVGPYDDTGRFSYWVGRMERGGRVLAPEPPEQPVQFIDVRDLADWILAAAETGLTGPTNAVGSPGAFTMASLLDGVGEATGSDAELEWVAEDFLLEHGVEPWSELPLWLPPASMPEYAGFMSRANTRALAHGLRFRTLADTVSATLEWLRTGDRVPTDRPVRRPPAGLDPEREAELLRAYRSEVR